MKFHVGYEIATGRAIEAELHHLAIFGLTQKSGKTTSLEAFINRIDGEFSVLVFRTGRGEIGFSKAARIPFYFRERTDWRFVEGIISAHLLEKNKILRANIMKACQGSRTLGEVWNKVRDRLSDFFQGDESVTKTVKMHESFTAPHGAARITSVLTESFRRVPA